MIIGLLSLRLSTHSTLNVCRAPYAFCHHSSIHQSLQYSTSYWYCTVRAGTYRILYLALFRVLFLGREVAMAVCSRFVWIVQFAKQWPFFNKLSTVKSTVCIMHTCTVVNCRSGLRTSRCNPTTK